jgi:16S rRNA (cytosine967-C5)-methyltransferase
VNRRVLSFAERIIGQTDRVNPADAVLRDVLRTQKDLAQEELTSIAHAVFSYFRWYRWLDAKEVLTDRIRRAVELASVFTERPESFSDAELMKRILPDWVHSEFEVTPEFARALQSQPQVWLRARPGQGEALAKRLGDCRLLGVGQLADTLIYRGRVDLFHTPEFHSGAFELQDVSSQAVGWVCAPIPGQTWWDVCAGEGGKLLHLSDLMQNQGLIWASDRAEWRLRRLKRRAARAKVFNYRVALWQGGSKLPTKTRFDGVLVDAPCTGIGTWQRNPHARWTLAPEDLKELTHVQLVLLRNAAKAVKPAGKLVYSVCSVARAETTGVVEAFEKENTGFVSLALPNPLDPVAPAKENLFLWPQQFGGNGMFIASWTRAPG